MKTLAAKKSRMDTGKITKDLEQTIDDFLTEHNLSLVHNESGATITSPSYAGDWNVSRSWVSESLDFKTLKGALKKVEKLYEK